MYLTKSHCTESHINMLVRKMKTIIKYSTYFIYPIR